LSGDFWDVRAFFPLLFSALAGNSRGIKNGILEATSIRGWFNLNRPFFVYMTFYRPYDYAINIAGAGRGRPCSE
jgi:hypothetical protein